MRVTEFTAPKSAVDVEAENLKREKQNLTDRASANKVKKAQQALVKQRQKTSAVLNKLGTAPAKRTAQ